jgi:hypothetical protein
MTRTDDRTNSGNDKAVKVGSKASGLFFGNGSLKKNRNSGKMLGSC